MKNYLLHCLFWCLFPLFMNAQQATGVLYHAPTEDAVGIQLKWLTQEIATRSGFNVYRRPAGGGGDWKKLNATPLVIGVVPMPEAQLAADSSLQVAHTLALGQEPADLPGLARLNFVAGAITEPNFARFLGIHYDDRTVTPSLSYDYEVRAIRKDREVFVARASGISAQDAPAFPSAPALSGKFREETKAVVFNWEHDQELAFAYHLHRIDPFTGERLRLNPRPIIQLSSGEDSPEYTDPTPGNAQRYRYELSAIDYLGRVSPKVATVEVELPDLLLPDAPTQPTSDNSQDGVIVLGWASSTSSDVAKYRIYRTGDVSVPAKMVAEVPGGTTSFTDKSLPGYGYYYYEITAVDAAGNESEIPLYHIANASDLYPPAPPAGVKITAESGSVMLAWDKNQESDLAGYIILRSIDVKGTADWAALHVEPITENRFENRFPPGMRNEIIYTVVAMDTTGNRSDYSEIVRIRMPDEVPPPVPFLESIRTSGDSVFLRWQTVYEGDMRGYDLQRNTEAGFISIQQPGKTSTSYVDAGLPQGVRAEYRLSSVDTVGNVSEPSGTLSVKIAGSGSDPKAFVLDGKYRKRDEAVRLEWPKAAGNSYVFRRLGGSGRFLPLGEKITDNSYVDKPGQSGRYDYLVKTYFPDGSRANSGILTINIK